MIQLEALRDYKFIYFATPYNLYKTGLYYAAVDAARLTARLIEEGINIYSPIVMTHFTSIYGAMDPDFDWLKHDVRMLEMTDCLLVGQMEGWQKSKGIAFERDYCLNNKKPVLFLNPVTMLVTLEEKCEPSGP